MVEDRPVPRAVGVKDVAALAGVSLGTVSNVLNRPDRVSADDPGQGRVGDGRARLRAQRVGPAAARRAAAARWPTWCSTPATRSSPTSPRASRTPPRTADLSVFICNSDDRADRERAYLDRLQEQRVQGILITPVDPDDPLLDELAAPRHARRGRRPDPRRRHALLGRRRRRARRPDRRRAPRRARARADRVRRRARPRSGRSATGCEGARQALAAAGLAPDRLTVLADLGADRRRGARRRRAAGRPARRPVARPPRSAPTTCSRSACSSSA